MREIITELEGLRRRGKVLLVGQRLSVLLAWCIAVILALIAMDFLLRLPSGFRLVLLLAGLGVLGYSVWRYLLTAARFAPTLTQIALRVERGFPMLAGRLASGVEFAAAGVDRTNSLAAISVRETEGRVSSTGAESMRKVIDPKSTVRDFVIFAGVVIVAATFVFVNPAAAQTGLARLFIPYGQTQWPARTGAESLMHQVVTSTGVHPRGQALPLRARVVKGDPGQRVEARYRTRLPDSAEFRPWQRVVLTRQGSSDVHERLIDTNAELIEIAFITQDSETPVETIMIVPPPAVVRAMLTITPPPYATGHLGVREIQDRDMGPGTDRRAVMDSPALAGSQVQLVMHLNKPLPMPAQYGDIIAWIRRTIGWDAQSELPGFWIGGDDERRWTLRWTLDRTRQLTLDLVDEHGLYNVEPIAYRIDSVEDQPPGVTITNPPSDEIVLASAMVPLHAEANDDVAVSVMAMEAHIQRAGSGEALVPRLSEPGVGDPIRGVVPPAEPGVPTPGSESRGTGRPAPAWSESREVNATSGSIATQIDLAALSLREGDIVHLIATAEDVYEIDGVKRDPTVSMPRRLRIISELELASQLRRRLSMVRQGAMRMEAMQSELQDSVIEDGVQPGIERAQAQIAERIAAQREAIEEIQRHVRMNRLDDAQIDSLLQQSRDLLDYAGRAATRAVDEIAQRQAEGGGQRDRSERDADFREPAEEDRDIVEAQQEVREELADLIELLDRDEDTWVVTRQLEGLVEEQSRLEAATSNLAERTIGQDMGDLSREDQTELDRIAQRQRELRDQARQLVDDLRRRADALQQVDQRSAEGMRSAARTAEERQLDREMEQAAERTGQNQLRNAQQSQQAAAETMRRMLQEMQETRQARAEQLMRQLDSLIDSIERLIVVQENELSALAIAVEGDDFTGRDRAMIRLNQNTQAVAAEARASGQQARRIARTLDRAGDAQGASIVALRSDPVRADAAEEAEERSLELLREAKELAEELLRQTQEDAVRQRREELIQQYREFAERQIVLRSRTLELAEQAGADGLDRRQMMEARRLGTQQDDLRTALSDIERTTREIADSIVFRHTHRNIDRWSSGVTSELNDGRVGRIASDRQEMIAQAIGRMIEALEEMAAPPPEFDDGQDGSGGGEGGEGGEQGLIPPVTELRLLRGLQEEVYHQTRQMDGDPGQTAEERTERLREIGREQRELMRLGEQMLEAMQNRP